MNKGQSTIEFLFSFIFIFGFIASFFKLSLNYSNGYIVHYATFMASRAYMVLDRNSNNPEGSDGAALKKAQDVFAAHQVDVFFNNFTGEVEANSPETLNTRRNNLYVGVFVNYSDSLGLPNLGPAINMDLRSESFLGREPTRSECYDQICNAMLAIGGDCRVHTTVFDNGC